MKIVLLLPPSFIEKKFNFFEKKNYFIISSRRQLSVFPKCLFSAIESATACLCLSFVCLRSREIEFVFLFNWNFFHASHSDSYLPGQHHLSVSMTHSFEWALNIQNRSRDRASESKVKKNNLKNFDGKNRFDALRFLSAELCVCALVFCTNEWKSSAEIISLYFCVFARSSHSNHLKYMETVQRISDSLFISTVRK